MPKSYRIRTQVGVDKYINVNLEQDWDQLEILSLKILANDVYTRFCADYGVVTGRVFVNNGFGLPNAKVSVFVPLEPADELDPVITELYPFKTTTDTTEDGYRYNLLPKLPSYDGHVSTGSFPNKADVLMDGSYIEVFDKYYRFTVTTNESGDFMIFGVPVGTQTIVMDIDLSDIGCFSLSPQDLILQGLATETQVNGARFKSSTNLTELPQIKNLVFDIDVRPFWGDADLCQVGITRVDFDLTKQANLTIQPTAIFMGSIISTTDDDALGVGCRPKNNTGNLCEIVSGPGEIEAIRQTIFSDVNGLPILERYEIEEGGKVIDGDGTYLLNVPMNLDYVFTNEFGEQVISNDPSKGVPTKGKYRFKFRWQNEEGLQGSFLRADFLVPNVKEYGWTQSLNDPFETYNSSPYYYPTIPAGFVTGTTINVPFNVGLAVSGTTNVESYQILINGQPYIGSLNSIQFNIGDDLQIIATPIDPTQDQIIAFTQYPQQLFDVLKSYAFSTDWDDYANVQDAINCEDTFYDFGYNKVYTTAMFLDRYKNGIGRARHLGIKEIDNRTCKSTVNTFPVNDIVRNFDFIFFVFNILINILTFPILVLLFVAHLIALLWPIIKVLLLFLGPYLIYQGVSAGIDLAYYIASLANFNLGGPVVSVGTILQIIAQGLKVLFLVAAGIWFTAWYVKWFKESLSDGKVDNFPRIGLPMIAYPDCTSCDCACGTAEIDDNVTSAEIEAQIDEIEQESAGGGVELVLAQPKGVIAPFNSAGSYSELNHPNLELDEDGKDPYKCTGLQFFQTLSTLIGNDEINQDVVVRAVLDFKRMASGYDVLSSADPYKYISDESYLLRAPQPFLFSAEEIGGGGSKDQRFFGYPVSVPLSQKLNEFNTRDKYFNNGPNQIRTWVNPSVNSSSTIFTDQVLVVIMNSGASTSIGAGGICTFQDPNITNGQVINRLINLTGATDNEFGNNAITGTTLTGNSINVSNLVYANPNGGSSQTSFIISSPSVSQKPVVGNSLVEQSYLQYSTDIEYFQLITGLTVSQLIGLTPALTVANSVLFPNSYLLHDLKYVIPDCSFDPVVKTVPNIITKIGGYGDYEVCIFVRGVDPFTAPQTIRYDLSKIFGHTTNNTITVEGTYYLNIPIQPLSGVKPAEHDTATNNVSTLYFPSFTFTPDSAMYTAFTSNQPYYYLSTDDNISSSYSPLPTIFPNNTSSTISGNLQQTLANSGGLPLYPVASTYTLGGTYLRWNEPYVGPFVLKTADNQSSPACDQECQRKQYYNAPSGWFISQSGSNPNGNPTLTAVYSPAYYRYTLPGVQFTDSTRIVMRSDRLPTSTSVQNGANVQTGYALHQNDNFLYYTLDGVQSPPSITAGGDLVAGDSFDEDPEIQSLTSTLTCEGMVPLECYSGSGSNVGVLPQNQCSIPANRMINGCYCLLNKKYVKEYGLDARLFLEWKVRFTMNFAACRGVFGQVFQNNWINGTLYMFNFNKRSTFSITGTPDYKYCNDVIVFNELTNIFYYRSSPWSESTQKFVGKESPQPSPFLPDFLEEFPGLGYNKKQIQFPTTVVDLGPRDAFINEVCCSADENGFGSYYADQIKTTSYQDNSSIVQLGFLSRILNQGVRQRILPISNGGDNSEGKGIIQFFNSERGGYRIDGDWAQMLSINSEWKVLPFITENIPSSDYIYFGDNRNSTGSLPSEEIKPIMGLFFTTPTENERYRKIMSSGIETYSFNPLLEQKFGYPKSQNVPHYKWFIKTPVVYNGTPNIFGSEDNNWYTEPNFNTGFFSKRYQDLDFTSPSEKYRTSLTETGYINSLDPNGDPLPITPLNNINQGDPSTNYQDSVVVGAPYHFYFGLNNGKTAINRFYKLYVATAEE